MLGPFIDTNIVCTLTALVILTTGVGGDTDGILLTVRAFQAGIPSIGALDTGLALLTVIIVLFSVSTLISYSYYSRKCAIYVLGERWGARYEWFYIGSILLGAVWAQDLVINMMDTLFAMMSIPTLLSALLLFPRVLDATQDYFSRMAA
ncbi:alanine:cation symporter family protein, partial [bacterium]|nr:alanine:cation symporter family protein [bacterium]